MSDADLICDLVVDHVVELLGRRYRKSQIKLQLARLLNEGKPLNPWTFNRIVSLAKKKIRSLYKIDPIEYKGCSIEFYESVLRDDDASLKYKIVANQNLDKLLGLEHLSTEDPEVYAEKLREAMICMDNSIKGESSKDEPSKSTSQSQSQESSVEVEESEEEYDERLKEAVKNVQLARDGFSLK